MRYESIKDARDWYYVEYSPPCSEIHSSSLHLTIEQEASAADVAEAMENEAQEWVSRYPSQ
jgi:hypothetical protein